MVGMGSSHNVRVAIRNNRIHISNNEEKIIFYGLGELRVNDKIVKGNVTINNTDYVIYKPNVKIGERKCIISFNTQKTEAYLTTKYTKNKETYLKVDEKENVITIVDEFKETDFPELLSREEINMYMYQANIVYGIKNDVIESVLDNRENEGVCIAKGMNPIDGIDDKVIVLAGGKQRRVDVNSLERINYREMYVINSVKASDKIGEIQRGITGVDGRNVLGKPIPRRQKKRIEVKASSGCENKNDKFYATIDGQPQYKGGYFTVNPLLTVESDVDIKIGNLNFTGDLHIKGEVKEGMKILATGSISIAKGIYRSEIVANGNVVASGNVTASTIRAGSEDVSIINKLENISQLIEGLEGLYKNVGYIKEKKLVKAGVCDNDIIRALLDTKYKGMSKNCENIVELYKESKENSTVKLIQDKLLGYGISNITNAFELLNLAEDIKNEREILRQEVGETYDINISFAHECNCKASGSIYVEEKGVVSCDIFAGKEIIFNNDESVCRGGHLKAGKLIRANIVGSQNGGITILEVLKSGRIFINTCYKNTIIVVGSKRYVCENDLRLVEAYIDNKGELIIDKLIL
ncbi:MAG: FapA family protein [Clostridium sp.]